MSVARSFKKHQDYFDVLANLNINLKCVDKPKTHFQYVERCVGYRDMIRFCIKYSKRLYNFRDKHGYEFDDDMKKDIERFIKETVYNIDYYKALLSSLFQDMADLEDM